jgi:mannose/cellobiose epimerase-like protein (N-acyl-D-glucosamine 2-epimerase family)
MQRALQEIVDRGQPAHAAEAARLLWRLTTDPGDAEALADAAALVDAYLHDPYLTRYPS